MPHQIQKCDSKFHAGAHIEQKSPPKLPPQPPKMPKMEGFQKPTHPPQTAIYGARFLRFPDNSAKTCQNFTRLQDMKIETIADIFSKKYWYFDH